MSSTRRIAANNEDIRLSKKLSYLLRHGAVRENLNIKPDGFVAVDELLQKSLHECTLEDIERIVDTNNKRRFTLRDYNGILEIKANQGHTITKIDNLNLRSIQHVKFDIIHGTYVRHWEIIKAEGLSRMKRNHIHFAKGTDFEHHLRHSAEVFIYIDFERATADGFKFLESENNVILCTGNEKGIVPTLYFLKVVSKAGRILSLRSRS